jgi:hypothetical protein
LPKMQQKLLQKMQLQMPLPKQRPQKLQMLQ